MADKTVRGRFVWHELMTPDKAGAQAFYTKVLGWKTQPWEHDPSYTMFAAPSGPLGGTAESSGTPHWLTYVRTDDIEATVEQARSLGANVSTEITDMPNGGKYAVLTDPQGAEFGVYSSTSEPESDHAPKRGEYSWYELATSDYRAAFDFYSQLFGWEPAGEHDMGGALGSYFMFGRNTTAIGGMFNRPPEMPGSPAWVGYVRVKDVQQTVKKVKAAGGTLILGPMEVPGGDWIAQFTDPQGALFAVHVLATDLKTAPAAVPTEVKAEPVAADDRPEPKAKRVAGSRSAKKSSGAKAKAPAKKSKKSTKKSVKKASRKVAKKAGKKKTAKAAAKSKAAKKRTTAARGVKRPARKTSKAKKSAKKRSGGTKKAAKTARKAK